VGRRLVKATVVSKPK